MKHQKIIMDCILLVFIAFLSYSDQQHTNKSLSTLYEEIFRGSKKIYVPERLYSYRTIAKKLFEIKLDNKYPLSYGSHQFKDNYEFPILSNDDEYFYYFYPPVNLASDDATRENIVALAYNKISKKTSLVAGGDREEIVRERLWGYYKYRHTESRGDIRLNVDDRWASIKTTNGLESGYIINPRDIDLDEDCIFLSGSVPYKSDLPFRQFDHDIELIVLSWMEGKIITEISFPFTGNYLPINMQTLAVQSVANQDIVYFVLRSNYWSDPTITVPQTAYRWHVLIYEKKANSLYSVWHGMDESDGKKELSFSYYLGKDGLYFEVLKEGKIEIYCINIDINKAKPLAEYETIDLLWNNKGLKAIWERKIAEAKAKDSSFKAIWK